MRLRQRVACWLAGHVWVGDRDSTILARYTGTYCYRCGKTRRVSS